MGLFSRRRDVRIPPGDDDCIVVGDDYYDGVPKRPRVGSRIDVELRREPRNRHDRNAVEVWVGGAKVGYLSSTAAGRHAPHLDALGKARVVATGEVRIAGSSRALFVLLPRPQRPTRSQSPRPPGGGRQSIYRSEYLSPEDEARYVTVDESGLPNLRLIRERGQFVMVVPQGMVNFRSRTLHRLDIFTFRVRGTSYHQRAAKRAELSPGSPLVLVREPDNPHDRNAIAIYSPGVDKPIGYVNRQNAARLAKRLDAGERLTSIAIQGSGAGRDDEPVTALVTTPEMLSHLLRRR